MEYMKNFIGGLFKNREDAERSPDALRENGLTENSINMLECTHEKEAVVLDKNPSIKSIGKSAPSGALIMGGIGAGIVLLVGLGVIHVPSLDPASSQALPFQITWQFILASMAAGAFLGTWTGAILGAAVRLAMPQYRKMDTTQEASNGGLMVAVQANDSGRETKVRSTLKEYGAFRFEQFRDQWDPDVWSLDRETPQVS